MDQRAAGATVAEGRTNDGLATSSPIYIIASSKCNLDVRMALNFSLDKSEMEISENSKTGNGTESQKEEGHCSECECEWKSNHHYHVNFELKLT